MKIVVFQGKDGWRWHLRSRNGRNIATSGEKFDSKWNAKRAAIAMRLLIRAQVEVEIDG